MCTPFPRESRRDSRVGDAGTGLDRGFLVVQSPTRQVPLSNLCTSCRLVVVVMTLEESLQGLNSGTCSLVAGREE